MMIMVKQWYDEPGEAGLGSLSKDCIDVKIAAIS